MQNSKPARKSDWPWLLAILLLAAAVRALHLVYVNLDSDHAVVGLMAMHMLDGEFTSMYWSSDYGGTQESWVAAAIFAVFGPSRPAVGAAAALPGMVFLLGLYLAGKELWGRRAGLAAMFLAALGPYYLIWHHTIPRGIYAVSLTMCVLMVWVAARMVHREPGTRAYAWYAFLLGLFAGQAMWNHPFTGAVALAVGLAVWRADPKLAIRPRLLMLIAGVVIGCAPWLYYNLTHNWQTVHYILAPKPRLGLWADLKAVFQGGLPVLIGITSYKGQGWAAPLLRHIVLVLWLGVGLWAAWRWGGQLLKRAVSAREGDGSEIPLLAALAVVGMFLLVHGAASNSYRYLIFLYAALPLAMGWAFDRLAGRGQAWRVAAWACLTLVAASNLAGSVMATPVLDAKWRHGYRANQARIQQLIDQLTAEGRRYAFTTDYWLAKLITFDSAEKLILAQAVRDRYPAYYFQALKAGADAFVAGREKDMASAAATLGAMGATYRVEKPGGFTVFEPVKPPDQHTVLVSPAGFKAQANVGPAPAGRGWDLAAATRWRSPAAQQVGEWLAIDLGRVVPKVCQVLLLAGKARDLPAGMELQGSLDGESWQRLGGWDSSVWPAVWSGGLPVIMEDAPWQELRFAPQDLRYLRLQVTEARPKAYWGLAEVLVGRSDPAAPIGDPAQAGRWINRAVKVGRVRCEPILRAWLRPELRVPPLAAFRPAWMPEFLTPRNAIAPDRPLTMAVRQAMLAPTLAVLEQCGWQAEHKVGHGFALITATPPRDKAPKQAGPMLAIVSGDDGWKIDLGKAREVGGLLLSGADPGLAAGGIRLLASVDGETWRQVTARPHRPPQLYWAGFTLLAGRAHPLRLNFTPLKARWLRLAAGRPAPPELKAAPLAP